MASEPSPDGRFWKWSWPDVAVIALAGVALRWIALGVPFVNVDEEYYLFMGARLLDGAIPYVDFWDRKPIGLILIYALAGMFGKGVWAYQVLALLSVIATAAIIYSMARIYADRVTSVMAGITYYALLDIANGAGGQTPIFYNLPITLSAAILYRLFINRDRLTYAHIVRGGILVMALCGLSLQIKPSVLIESVFFGLTLLWLAKQRAGTGCAIKAGLMWVTIAILPTIIIATIYYAIGHLDAYFFSNVTSIQLRRSEDGWLLINRLLAICKVIAAPILLGVNGGWQHVRVAFTPAGRLSPHLFIILWSIAALFALLLFGGYFLHYALSLAAPTALLFAFASGRWLLPRLLLVFAGAGLGLDAAKWMLRDREGWFELTQMMRDLPPPRNCPYMYEGSPLTYHLNNYCTPTRYPFTYHLNLTREDGSLGIDPNIELRRIMSRNPDYVMARLPLYPDHRREAALIMFGELNARYHVARIVDRGGAKDILYKLNERYVPLPNDGRDLPPAGTR